MDHTVVLLVLAGELMLLDIAFSIVISMRAYHESVLCTAVHCLRIYIIVWLLILYEPAPVLPCLEIVHSLVVSRLTVLVDDRIEVDLRLRDVEKGLFASLVLCLNRIEDVVWTCGYFLYILLRRTYRREWLYAYHDYLFTWNLVQPVAK